MDNNKDHITEAANALSELGASKGGKARAASLSPEERSDIARGAAEARWASKGKVMIKETHPGILKVGAREIPCAVLDNGLRVLSTTGVIKTMGSKKKGRNRKPSEDSPQLPPFLSSENIRPFISNELMGLLVSPIQYKPKIGGGFAFGYEATLLPKICEVILDANKAGVLKSTQKHLIETAEVLIRGFAQVGIIALIDEATGYQYDRARDELNKILEAYISKELLPWTKKFPDEFFKQIYKLMKWEFKPGNPRRPQVVGKLINKYIYEPLPPGILTELRRINPPTEKGYRKHRHHQFLTTEIGHPHLDKQVIEVVTLMRVSNDRRSFDELFQRAFPKRGQQLSLELKNEEKTEKV